MPFPNAYRLLFHASNELCIGMPTTMANGPPETLREQTASRLPTYRHIDIAVSSAAATGPGPGPGGRREGRNGPAAILDDALATTTLESSNHNDNSRAHITPQHTRNHSANAIIATTPSHHDPDAPSPKLARHLTLPSDFGRATQQGNPSSGGGSSSSIPPQEALLSPKARKNAPVTIRKDNNGPPLSMITQGYFEALSPTTSWVAQQSTSIHHPAANEPHTDQPPPSAAVSKSSRATSATIKPIRGFKPSSRRQSAEMASRRSLHDADDTIRAVGGNPHNHTYGARRSEQDEQNSDESDLFLSAAREEEQSSRQLAITNGDSLGRSHSLRSQLGQRASAPSGTLLSNALLHRRGSDTGSTNGASIHKEAVNGMAYRSAARDRPSAIDDGSKSRYHGVNARSMPNTPKAINNREISPPESQVSFGGQRQAGPDVSLPSRSGYRASNLSYNTPGAYGSSPLVSRATTEHDLVDMPRAAGSAESTVSTTAPSTVWDELEDLKSRIHRLELTGQLPGTSGAAMNRAAGDRPPTATTTVTTMSSSPKRGQANTFSQGEQMGMDLAASNNEAHPLLQAALTKSKALLSGEIYKALEATTSDALAIASMTGTAGQVGLNSGSQSVAGGHGVVSDRQVRRKADSLCRSLTELCLALTEGKNEVQNAVAIRSGYRGTETGESAIAQRQPVNNDLARVKSSPRALSRLEARRSSLLATSGLTSPRFNAPSESGTPTQSSVAGRRTSLLLRGRRGATEEPEEEDESQFRAPSRAVTEVNQVRNSPREYMPQQPLPERQSSMQSSLPIRRHYPSNSLTSSNAPISTPPISSLGGRRFLDRSTPERDNNAVTNRLAEDRGARKSSISQAFGLGRTGSLTRRLREPSSGDFSNLGAPGGYN